MIDTNRIIDVLHGNTNAGQTLIDLAPDGLAISLIRYGELFEGVHYAHNPEIALNGLRTFLRNTALPLLTIDICGSICHRARPAFAPESAADR